MKVLSIAKYLLLGLFILVAVVAIASFAANLLFQQQTTEKVNAMFSDVATVGTRIVQEEDLTHLPGIVQTWLRDAGVVGREYIETVRLKQVAELRMNPEQNWMPTTVEQYVTIEKPRLIWEANIRMAPLVHISGRDSFDGGEGHMLIKVLSLLPVVDARGPELDQATMLRYMAEMVWFPTLALSPFLTWKEADSNTAEATMTYGGVTASGLFNFNALGEVQSVEADRYREQNGQFSLDRWVVRMDDHQVMDGIKIPSSGGITWELDEGDFDWFRFQMTDIEYNQAKSY